MKELGVIYLIVQTIFILIAILKMNLPEGLFITIIPAIVVAVIIRRLLFGKIE
ncbi:MAG: hypothetical protein ACR2NW_01195 [Thermodesulfobacteriota bacterium]